MPEFDKVFQTGAALPAPSAAASPLNKEDDISGRFFPKAEPGAYLGTQPRFADFINQIQSKEVCLVLDVGCGPGQHRNEISRRAEYVGMDFDRSLSPEVVCDFNTEKFPFPDNHFDFVFSDSVLEHVMNPFVVMDEMYRVLKPGGRGYLLVPFHYKTHGAPWDFFRFSKGGVHLLLSKFSWVEIYPIGGSLSVLCHILWNYGRMVDRVHVLLGNVCRCVIWCVFRVLNPLDRYDPYKVFTRGHYAFFEK
jgi:SAM-dependent methyltransferase